jgi:hypothetical protein
MINDLSKQTQRQLDGFDTFDDTIESGGGEQTPTSSFIIQGNRIAYGDAKIPFKWLDKVTGELLSTSREFVAIDLLRVVQKWLPAGGNNPPDTQILAPGEKFPDIDKLNAETPKNEWRIGPDGKPKGPYERAFILYLLDPDTLERFTYVASTIGGMRAVRELRERVNWMRKFRGTNVYAVITFADTFMKTDYGGRQRPHFIVVKFIRFGDSGTPLPAPEQPTLTVETVESPTPKASPQTAKSPTQIAGAQTVEPLSLKEEMDDVIPF